MKTVYTCFCTDVIHEGHLNIIHKAMEYGEVIVGVLSDSAMIRFNRFPTISFEERVKIVSEIEGVSQVVVQDEIVYDDVIGRIHPDYVIHGDNWLSGPTHDTVAVADDDQAQAAFRNSVYHLRSRAVGRDDR